MSLGIFDKQSFADLLRTAIGTLSISEFGRQINVSPSHISRLLRQLTPGAPSPEIIKKITEKAQNHITYEQLMTAAGHLSYTSELNATNALSLELISLMDQKKITHDELEQILNEIRSKNAYN